VNVSWGLRREVEGRVLHARLDVDPQEDRLARRAGLHPSEEGHGRLAPIPAPKPSVDVLDAFARPVRDQGQLVRLSAPVLELRR